MRIRGGRHAALPLVLSASLLAGSTAGGTARGHAAAIPQGGTVIAAEAQTPDSINPYLNQQISTIDIDSAIFDSLVKYDPKGIPTPDLATRWTTSKDGLHWTFYLNPKAQWQDGVPFTASDIVFTSNLVNNPKFPAANNTGFTYIKSISAVGKYQVDITLTKPYAPFLSTFGTHFFLPQHVLGKIPVGQIRTDAQYNRYPLGTGPFKVTEYTAGDHITLSANPHYFLGAPHLSQIIFRIVPNNATLLNQLRTGEITLAGQTSNLDPRQFNSLKHTSGIITYNTAAFDWYHIDTIETGFLKDVRVRQALQMATPREKIIKDVLLGYGVPQYSDQSPNSPYYNKAVESYWPYNPAKASALLASIGFTKGSNGVLQKGGVPLNITLYADSSSLAEVQATEIVKAAWQAIGASIDFRPIDAATEFGRSGPLWDPNRLSLSKVQAFEYEWLTNPDPDDSYFWSSTEIISPKVQAGGNFVGYSNPQIDDLVQQGVATSDVAKRKAIYAKIQVILARDVPVTWLWWGRTLTATTSKLHNYIPNAFQFNETAWNAKDWYLQ
jgi:peptide/nickel transport system substrate-binding protein